jgi:hypothetical protein
MEQAVSMKKERHKRPRIGIPGGLCTINHPLLYLNVPKSACTTIKNLLYYIDNGKAYHDPIAIHGDDTALLKPSSADKEGYLNALRNRKVAFTFVREPFARAYSAFNEKIFFTTKYSFLAPRVCLTEDYGARFPAEGASYTAAEHADNFLKFLNFVQDTIDETAKIKLNPHWSPQTIILANHRRRVNTDFVGKVENFQQGMRFVLDLAKVDVPVDLSVRHNEGPKPPFTLAEIINDEIHAKLASVYGNDVDYFGYHAESAKWAR